MMKLKKKFASMTVRLMTAPQSYGGRYEKSDKKTSLQQT